VLIRRMMSLRRENALHAPKGILPVDATTAYTDYLRARYPLDPPALISSQTGIPRRTGEAMLGARCWLPCAELVVGSSLRPADCLDLDIGPLAHALLGAFSVGAILSIARILVSKAAIISKVHYPETNVTALRLSLCGTRITRTKLLCNHGR